MSAKKTKKVKTTPSSVCRVNKNANYTVMSNYHLRSTNLSLKAIGLLSKVLSGELGLLYLRSDCDLQRERNSNQGSIGRTEALGVSQCD